MSETLYLQFDTNIEITHPHVYLQDIAKISCSDSKILNRVRVLTVTVLCPDKPGRYVLSVMDLISAIRKKEPSLEITTIGASDFILTYKPASAGNFLSEFCKITFVCLVSFFGSAFSIMTFNNDVDVPVLFQYIYKFITGHASDGFTILEISYSIGLGIGVLFFFNHFGSLKLTSDPTPMQVQMRQYEDNINNTIVEDIRRKGEGLKL